MNKCTQDQLKEMTNEQRDEVVALAQGRHKVEFDNLKGIKPLWVLEPAPTVDGVAINIEDYHPSTNKEQAWDLMIKYKLVLIRDMDDEWGVLDDDSDYLVIGNKDPLIAVVIASILHLQESE